MLCRFEDRLAGRALRLDGLRRRIEARAAAEVGPALQAIEAERRQGRWVALMLDYELGEWLLPEAARAAPAGPWTPPADDGRPRLRALVFDGKTDEAPWDSPGPDAPAATLTPAAPRMAEADYLRRIDEIRDLIGAGELYQVNYTQPLDLRLAGDPATLYRRIAARNPVAHAAFIQDGERSVLSFSPELFIRRDGERLTTRPMKGTAPRHPDRTEDERLGRELLASEKNRAENLMIVDLLRNDLPAGRARLGDGGRAVLAGTLSHGLDHDVHRLGARPRASLEDVLRALFPCGSITGAPRSPPCAASARWRSRRAACTAAASAGWRRTAISLNVAIRTLVVDAAGAGVYGVGGGIVHDSDPASEWQECHWKARILKA